MGLQWVLVTTMGSQLVWGTTMGPHIKLEQVEGPKWCLWPKGQPCLNLALFVTCLFVLFSSFLITYLFSFLNHFFLLLFFFRAVCLPFFFSFSGSLSVFSFILMFCFFLLLLLFFLLNSFVLSHSFFLHLVVLFSYHCFLYFFSPSFLPFLFGLLHVTSAQVIEL